MKKRLSKWQRNLLALHEGRAVPCQVSSRYLRFDKADSRELGFGYPVSVDVMSNNYGDKPDRKLCELVFSLEDLEAMVAQLRDDVSAAN